MLCFIILCFLILLACWLRIDAGQSRQEPVIVHVRFDSHHHRRWSDEIAEIEHSWRRSCRVSTSYILFSNLEITYFFIADYCLCRHSLKYLFFYNFRTDFGEKYNYIDLRGNIKKEVAGLIGLCFCPNQAEISRKTSFKNEINFKLNSYAQAA